MQVWERAFLRALGQWRLLIIEISTHGSVLKRDHESFVVVNGEEKVEVPAAKVDAIIVTSNALLSTQAIRLCIERNIELIVSDWSGRPISRMWQSTPGKNTEIRRKQYLNQDTAIAFEISLEITTIKMKGQKKFLIDLKNNRQDASDELEAAIYSMSVAVTRLKDIKFSGEWKEVLLGIEGACAAAYFKAISASLPSLSQFTHRSQYPAKDGFNAVLNYVYGMGYSSIEKVIIMSGLDPNAGFYHADSYGKPTLCFDLMELVRPLLDRTAVSLFTKRVVNEDWFEKQQEAEAVFLSKKSRLAIIEAYADKNRKAVESVGWDYCKKVISMLNP
jgi:CRISP-associated protein Cas1